jgi:hypothetical protein
MSSARLTAALKYIFGCCTVLFFVVLLTLVFSFLGTLICAALSGMMMGATKAPKKISIPFSAFFPCVLVGVLRAQKSELAGTQLILLAVLCLASFWIVHLTGAVLMAYEKRDTTDRSIPASTVPTSALPKLRLEELEGHWSCEVCGADGRIQRRFLEIKNGVLALSTMDAEGRVCSCTRGCVELVAPSGISTLLVSPGVETIPSPSI